MADTNSASEDRSLSADAIKAQLNFLKGEVLTIIDAAFSDKEQRKAVKDLVRFQFDRRIRYMDGLCHGYASEACSNPYQNISSETIVERKPEL